VLTQNEASKRRSCFEKQRVRINERWKKRKITKERKTNRNNSPRSRSRLKTFQEVLLGDGWFESRRGPISKGLLGRGVRNTWRPEPLPHQRRMKICNYFWDLCSSRHQSHPKCIHIFFIHQIGCSSTSSVQVYLRNRQFLSRHQTHPCTAADGA